MATLPAILEFGIRRNLRVLNAKVRGVFHATFQRVLGGFGSSYKMGPQTSVYGTKFASNFSDKTFRYCLYGTYGKRFANYLAAQTEPFIFLDVGANQGLFTMVAAQNPHCVKAIALEPVSRTHALLAENAELNGVADKTVTVQVALSDAEGTAEIATKSNHSGVASLHREPHQSRGQTETIKLISAKSLDTYLPDDTRIIVKVDVEGHEAVVIDELLRSARAGQMVTIFHEMDERWTDADQIRAMLERAGYSRFDKWGIGRHYDVLAER